MLVVGTVKFQHLYDVGFHYNGMYGANEKKKKKKNVWQVLSHIRISFSMECQTNVILIILTLDLIGVSQSMVTHSTVSCEPSP